MKKTISLFVALSFCIGAFAVKPYKPSLVETPASDSRVTYVGRTLVSGGDVSFDWSGTMVKLSFEGNYLAIKVSDTDKNYYNLWIDKEPSAEADKVITVRGTDTTIVLYSDVEFAALSKTQGRKSSHTAFLRKRTEGEQGKTTIHSIITGGKLLQAEGVKERVIEFVGDSYTCGYGSENSISTDPFTKETENQNKAYDAILGRYFDADVIVVAHSGMGVNRNYGDALNGYYMPERYLNVFDNGSDRVEDAPKWNPSMGSATPDITVVYLGTNDFSVSKQPTISAFTSQYRTLLSEIKDNYGKDHPILCIASKTDDLMCDYVRKAAMEAGLENVRFTAFFDGVHADDDTELGASSHPNYQAHRKLAHQVIPYIATMTGWGLQDRPVR